MAFDSFSLSEKKIQYKYSLGCYFSRGQTEKTFIAHQSFITLIKYQHSQQLYAPRQLHLIKK